MLPTAHRLTSPTDFRTTVRRGFRVGRRTVVLHALPSEIPPTRVGFVVSKAVGNAVTRNRVKRRLRHLVAERVHDPLAALVVVRALPGCAALPDKMRADLAGAWREAWDRMESPS